MSRVKSNYILSHYTSDGLVRHIDKFDIEAEREGKHCRSRSNSVQRRLDIAAGLKKCKKDDKEWNRLVAEVVKKEQENILVIKADSCPL